MTLALSCHQGSALRAKPSRRIWLSAEVNASEAETSPSTTSNQEESPSNDRAQSDAASTTPPAATEFVTAAADYFGAQVIWLPFAMRLSVVSTTGTV